MTYKQEEIQKKIPILLFICGDTSKEQFVHKKAIKLNIGKIKDKKGKITIKDRYNLSFYQELEDSLTPPYRTPIGMINEHFKTTSTKTIRKCLIEQLKGKDEVLEKQGEERYSYWSIKRGQNTFKKIISIAFKYNVENELMRSYYYKKSISKYGYSLICDKFNMNPKDFGNQELDVYVFTLAFSPMALDFIIDNKQTLGNRSRSILSSTFYLKGTTLFQNEIRKRTRFKEFKSRNMRIMSIFYSCFLKDIAINQDLIEQIKDFDPEFEKHSIEEARKGYPKETEKLLKHKPHIESIIQDVGQERMKGLIKHKSV